MDEEQQMKEGWRERGEGRLSFPPVESVCVSLCSVFSTNQEEKRFLSTRIKENSEAGVIVSQLVRDCVCHSSAASPAANCVC